MRFAIFLFRANSIIPSSQRTSWHIQQYLKTVLALRYCLLRSKESTRKFKIGDTWLVYKRERFRWHIATIRNHSCMQYRVNLMISVATRLRHRALHIVWRESWPLTTSLLKLKLNSLTWVTRLHTTSLFLWVIKSAWLTNRPRQLTRFKINALTDYCFLFSRIKITTASFTVR